MPDTSHTDSNAAASSREQRFEDCPECHGVGYWATRCDHGFDPSKCVHGPCDHDTFDCEACAGTGLSTTPKAAA